MTLSLRVFLLRCGGWQLAELPSSMPLKKLQRGLNLPLIKQNMQGTYPKIRAVQQYNGWPSL